jgi:hypothetical protein
MSLRALGAGQNTGSPVFDRRVAISPALKNVRGKRNASFGPSPVNIISPIAGRM